MGIDNGDSEKDEDDEDNDGNGKFDVVSTERIDGKRRWDANIYFYATFKFSSSFSIKLPKARICYSSLICR